MEAAVLKPTLRMLTDLASSGFRQEVLLSVGCALDRVVATPCGCPGPGAVTGLCGSHLFGEGVEVR